MFNNYNEQDNDWANDVKGNPIHISQAESGAKGYYCMGCTKEMQAVKRKIANYQSYFRHHVKDVDHSKTECVHASKEYREKLAFFYFNRVKQIKVPAVYKFPPKGLEGNPVLLQEATTIVAHRVDREVTFFEDENGVIHSGKNPTINERYLWIRPDAVFYDKEDKPILFLEFVVTHKPDIDKINKLQRLGIDTVQIIVPKLPEVELEKSISQVSKVKWTYHEIESNTEYLPLASGNTEGIPSIDEEQRKLFEESYKCRAAQISNLIRAINRCMESESYKRIERNFEQEIQRIEIAASELRTKLDGIRKGIEKSIHSELGERRKEFTYSKEEFQRYHTNLEGRYTSKRRKLKYEQADTEREIAFRQRVERTEEGVRIEFERIERELVRGTEEVEREFENIRAEEERIRQSIEKNTAFESNFAATEEELRNEFTTLEKSEQDSFNNARQNFETKIGTDRETKNEIETLFQREFEGICKQIAERVNNRDVQGRDDLSARIKTILDLRGLFERYNNGQSTIEICRKGIQVIKNGTWKEWDK